MKIQTYNAGSLGEYVNCIEKIARAYSTDQWKTRPPVLWFRGQNKATYSLIPSLYRSGPQIETTPEYDEAYTKLHYAGDIRMQHYMAKNFHLLKAQPSAKIEWLEVMQHHGIKTRLLDWSESAVHSLLFALESFFDGKNYDASYRQQCTPCVWVLNPGKMNRLIFEKIRQKMAGGEEKKDGLYKQLKADFKLEKDEVEKLFREYGEFAKYMETDGTSHIDYIINLSKINEELLRERESVRKLLEDGTALNPYYYVLSRIYSDGLLMKNRTLPPLAIVNAYHSERIKAQKGVFTVYPYYMERENDKELRKMGITPEAMEHNEIAQKCLHKIVLSSPQKIAYELLACGINTSWLYPEMPIIANEIENREIL